MLTPKKIKELRDISKLLKGEKTVKQELQDEQEFVDLVEELGIIPEKGDKGDRGERGEKGEPGINGKDGVNGKDGRDGKDGKDGLNGFDGKDGKDGINPTVDEVIEALKKLKGKQRIPLSAIIDGEFIKKKGDFDMSDQRWHGSGDGSHFSNVQTVTSSMQLPLGGGIFFINASSENINLTMPSALNQLGFIYKIKKVDSSTNSVIISTVGVETIDDESQLDVADYNNAPELVSDGFNWKIT